MRKNSRNVIHIQHISQYVNILSEKSSILTTHPHNKKCGTNNIRSTQKSTTIDDNEGNNLEIFGSGCGMVNLTSSHNACSIITIFTKALKDAMSKNDSSYSQIKGSIWSKNQYSSWNSTSRRQHFEPSLLNKGVNTLLLMLMCVAEPGGTGKGLFAL